MIKQEYIRTPVSGQLVVDKELSIDNVLYIPVYPDEESLTTGDNDPLKPGAIATFFEEGVLNLAVYQGGNVWKPVNLSDIKLFIAPWTESPTKKDTYRTFAINGTEYLFRSLVENNVSQPTLSADNIPAWTDLGSSGIFLNWDLFTSFSIDTLVRMNNVIYRSKSADPGHNPELDSTNTYWDRIGAYAGFFASKSYNLNDIVNDPGNALRRWKSNIANNNLPLNGTVSDSSWQVIGPIIDDDHVLTTATWSSSKINAELSAKVDKQPGKSLIDDSKITKLDGIQTGATANSTDNYLLSRANHTGTQLAATISNFATTVLGTVLAGISFVTTTAVTAADSILVAIGKLQAQINNKAVTADIKAGTDILKIPTAKSLADSYDYNSETLVATTGALNNQVTPTSTLRLTGTSSAAIISGFAGARDGKRLKVTNNTGLNATILHNSAASTAGNRIMVTGNADVYLFPDSTAEFVFSVSLNAWFLSGLWGTEYLPNLKGGTVTKTLEVLPSGYMQAADSLELITVNTTRATTFTKADINVAYPNHRTGMFVNCRLIDTMYMKQDDINNNWIAWPTTNLT